MVYNAVYVPDISELEDPTCAAPDVASVQEGTGSCGGSESPTATVDKRRPRGSGPPAIESLKMRLLNKKECAAMSEVRKKEVVRGRARRPSYEERACREALHACGLNANGRVKVVRV